MRVLLDTHAMLWWWTEPSRFRKKTLTLLGDPATVVMASSVSAYELAYKHQNGRLMLPEGLLATFSTILAEERWTPLPLSIEQSLLAGQLATPHCDPFDRLLGAQAILEEIPLVTLDPAFDSFHGLRVLW